MLALKMLCTGNISEDPDSNFDSDSIYYRHCQPGTREQIYSIFVFGKVRLLETNIFDICIHVGV